MITILFLFACPLIGFGWVRLVAWFVHHAEKIECEPLGDPPCPMCERPRTGPDHDCAAGLAKAMLTPDCPTIVAGSDIDASQWAGIVAQLPELAAAEHAKKLEALYLIPEQP